MKIVAKHFIIIFSSEFVIVGKMGNLLKRKKNVQNITITSYAMQHTRQAEKRRIRGSLWREKKRISRFAFTHLHIYSEERKKIC
jgi:hypothetical protein